MASPPTIATASGRNTGRQAVSAAKARNRPLLVTSPKNAGPPPPPLRLDSLSATPMSTGMAARTTQQRHVAAPAEHQAQLGPHLAAEGAAVGAAQRCSPGERARSADDIETLPGELDEQVFQGRPLDHQSPYGNPGGDQGSVDLLDRDRRRQHGEVLGRRVTQGQAEPAR